MTAGTADPPTSDPADRSGPPGPARRDGVTVLVPTLDEELTIAGVVDEVQRAGATRVVVVDSGSTDRTVHRARAAGAECVDAASLGPPGPVLGKGDALWRALPLVDTELVVFLDGDLVIDGPRFLGGLLAPLADPGVVLSKADFRRVRRDGTDPEPGRVTQLVARPVLALLFPELAGLHEPLSGQVAARTDVLLTLPFEGDYGLEMGMLIDVYRRFGIDAIAHPHCADLSHLRQSDGALAPMAEQVLRAALSRAGPGGVGGGDRRRPPHRPG